MTEKQQKCGEQTGHNWKDQGLPKRDLSKFDPLMRVPVKCNHCKLEADEVYTYICTLSSSGEEV